MRRLPIAIAGLLAVAGAAVVPLASTASPASSARPAAAAGSHQAGPGLGIKHVFVIVFENESYAAAYKHNPNPYLGKKLQKQGTLLTHYYAIGHDSLDNYIAMISGQAPNDDTSGDCPYYGDFNDTTADATIDANGQAVGTGCVFPENVETLADQLNAAGITWHGYMDEMGKDPTREESVCGVPTLTPSGKDDTQEATKKDQYAARHNPFVYFHSLIDSGSCAQNVTHLSDLKHDLKATHTTAKFTWITPDLCNDGHDSPCIGKDSSGSRKGGLAAVDDFLSKWVPKIQKSPAYQKNGLIIITSDESKDTDTSSCCHEQPGPSDPKPGKTGPGGGRIGTLVIGRCVKHGKKDSKHYNHYSLLRSLEDLYGITTGGTDGLGHLGYAAASGLHSFGPDLFAGCPNA
jgi:hypothetical protein